MPKIIKQGGIDMNYIDKLDQLGGYVDELEGELKHKGTF